MLKKCLSLVLVGLLLNLICVSTASASVPEKEIQFIEKVRAGVAKLGTGTQSRVEVKLRDGRKLKGYIGEIGDDHFVVMDSKDGVAVPVAYPQVKQVKGNNLSTGVKIAIGVVLVFAAGVLLAIIFPTR
jgi:hypothetical protein